MAGFSGVPGGAAFVAWIASSEQTGLCDLAAFVEPFLRLGGDAASPLQPVVLRQRSPTVSFCTRLGRPDRPALARPSV
jgi:hypothetical protein